MIYVGCFIISTLCFQDIFYPAIFAFFDYIAVILWLNGNAFFVTKNVITCNNCHYKFMIKKYGVANIIG